MGRLCYPMGKESAVFIHRRNQLLLAIDIGNSQTSFGVFEGSNLLHHWRAQTMASRTPDEYVSLLFPLLDLVGIRGKSWQGIALCSVVPPADYSFEKFCEIYLKCRPLRFSPTMRLGFDLHVKVPSEVGADRLANAAYALKHLTLPAIVVDIGTAMTFDIVSKERRYEGGVILPGPRIAMEALSGRTSKLLPVELQFPHSVIGKDTVECIQSGILFGYCEMIDGLLRRTQEEMGEPCEIALTGGLGFLFQERLRTPVRMLPNLTLEGIEILYRQNV